MLEDIFWNSKKRLFLSSFTKTDTISTSAFRLHYHIYAFSTYVEFSSKYDTSSGGYWLNHSIFLIQGSKQNTRDPNKMQGFQLIQFVTISHPQQEKQLESPSDEVYNNLHLLSDNDWQVDCSLVRDQGSENPTQVCPDSWLTEALR